MTTKEATLVQVLADTDALFTPNRNWVRPRPSNTYHGRQDYRRSGVPWASGEATEADRKAAQRELEALAEEGAVVVYRPSRIRTRGVRLSDAGESWTRALCGLPCIECGWWTAYELAQMSKRPGEAQNLDDVWISEVQLAGTSWPRECEDTTAFRHRMVATEELALPALSRGWVVANSDIHGRVYYALTASGWDILGGDPPEEEDTPDIDGDVETRNAYLQRVQAQLSRLDTAAPKDPKEIGDMPLPVAITGIPLIAVHDPSGCEAVMAEAGE